MSKTSFVSQWFLRGIVATLPAESTALEAKSIMASVALQDAYAFGASSAEVPLVEVEAALL